MEQITITYDGSYEGLLSSIFESFRLKISVERIVPCTTYQDSLFAEPVHVETSFEWAERVKAGIHKKGGKTANRLLYRCFLSEQENIEMLILHFVQQAVSSPFDVTRNYRDEKVLELHKINKKIGREVHRMHAFVRFQKTKDDIFTSIIEPDFDVLPLIGNHFEKRYPVMQWLIYDTKRNYGIFYNKDKVNFVTFEEKDHLKMRQLSADILTADESEYQNLWKSYFKSVNIPERNNQKLHVQHVPKRYWKYLTEK
jgi:probable DNA metabolism protein